MSSHEVFAAAQVRGTKGKNHRNRAVGNQTADSNHSNKTDARNQAPSTSNASRATMNEYNQSDNIDSDPTAGLLTEHNLAKLSEQLGAIEGRSDKHDDREQRLWEMKAVLQSLMIDVDVSVLRRMVEEYGNMLPLDRLLAELENGHCLDSAK
ncbi:MAG: hypothetical protein M1833_004002 [Piccolia ochrophora]|nr:MAG: hypothetical protein M1833_004002 [Piccolia ochrophora]